MKLSVKNLLGMIVFLFFLPFILLIFEPELVIYLKIHLAISTILIVLVIATYFRQGAIYKILLLSIIFYPVFLFATFPFSLGSFFIFVLLTTLGLIIPFLSLKATWWFYTIGGRYPLPKEHKWLNNKRNVYYGKKEKYNEFVVRMGKLVVPLAVAIGTLLSMSQNDLYIIAILKLLSLLGIFGLGLTAGTKLKKEFFLSIT